MQGNAKSRMSIARPETEEIVLETSALGADVVPARVLIAPWGRVESSSGSFVVDEEGVRETIDTFSKHGTDLPVDYEHQTLGGSYSSPSGQAPAAGWIKSLAAVPPDDVTGDGDHAVSGLWANVEWTEEATEKLRDRQYRYLSPVALVRRRDRRLVGLHSVALTNKPAIVGMRPVVNRDAAEAAEKDALRSAADELRGVLSLEDGVEGEVILVAAAERIRTLEKAEAHQQASQRVARAMSAGKLTAVQREWAMDLAVRDPEEFDRWNASAPVVVPLGGLGRPESKRLGLNGDSRRAAESAARVEWRANRHTLEKLCTEEAYVACALREDISRN